MPKNFASDLHLYLLHLGLTESDARIYALLQGKGECDVPTLQMHTKLSRTAIYNAINTLTERTLITQRKEGKNAYYSITNPQHLLSLLEEKRKHDLEVERNFKQDVNALTHSFNLSLNQPGVHIFNGKEGIVRVYDELLDDGLDIDSIEDKGEMEQFIPEYFPIFIKKRVSKKIHNRVIAPSSNSINTHNTAELRKVHNIPVEQFSFEMDIKMNAKKVVMTTFKKQTAVGVVIIHPEIVKNYQTLFNWMWSITK